MFNDRDIAVIGIGAVASVLCLLLPVPFPWKIGLGFTTLVVFMVAALLRLGGDRLTLEEYVFRRIRYWMRPRNWTFQLRDLPLRAPRSGKKKSGQKPVPETGKPGSVLKTGASRFAFDIGSIGAERLAGVLLVVVGLYFLEWLRLEGARTLGSDLSRLLP
jgi:hypothetical protein